MFTCKKLKSTNINIFRGLNSERTTFNYLNEDFFYLYDKINPIDKLMMMKKVILLQHRESLDYVGYIWTYKLNKYNHKIRALNIIKEYKYEIEAYSGLLNCAFKENSSVNYVCSKNSYNFYILSSLGFERYNGTLEMKKHINSLVYLEGPRELEVCSLYGEEGDNLRCQIQNSVFESNNRIPLTMDDIIFEKKQKYYYENGCFLLKSMDEYIGYGQVIFEEDNIPCIVNFGIIPKYRGKGYSRYFLNYILNSVYEANYSMARIRVSSENKIALNLYSSMGFYVEDEIYKWQFIK
ncbi:GNAT family N-acetyltransferase [Haloimpatiens lingqiaonensis]|uniref:GNAT family N-acetyltransferase n=1 Tax=Haloimpatiens lingqiaonensis TaxID=1380675 RepID=UPI0037BF5689